MIEPNEMFLVDPDLDSEQDKDGKEQDQPGEYDLNEDDLEMGDDIISAALAELERVPDAVVEAAARDGVIAAKPSNSEIEMIIFDGEEAHGGVVSESRVTVAGSEKRPAIYTEEITSLKSKVAQLQERLDSRTEKYREKLNLLKEIAEEAAKTNKKLKKCTQDLQTKLDEKTEEAEENKNNWVEASAAYQNLQRRSKLRVQEFAEMEKVMIIKQVLPVFDNLVRSLDFDEPTEGLLEGVRLIVKQCGELLESWDVKPIPDMNQPFDPYFHEAISRIPRDDVPNNTIVEVLQKGYTIGDRVLLPTKVSVSYPTPDIVAKKKKTKQKTQTVTDKIVTSEKEIDVLQPDSTDNAQIADSDADNAIKDSNLESNSVNSHQNALDSSTNEGKNGESAEVEKMEGGD